MDTKDVQNLFCFNRGKLVEPFEELTVKRVSVKSRYSPTSYSTISSSMVKAINAICKIRQGTMRGAIGTTSDGKFVVEYKSAIRQRATCLLVSMIKQRRLVVNML